MQHQKDESYHQSAIFYNDELASFAENLAGEVSDEEVKRWCRAVGKQHRFHSKRHKAALRKMKESKEAQTEGAIITTGAEIEQVASDEVLVEVGAEEKTEAYTHG